MLVFYELYCGANMIEDMDDVFEGLAAAREHMELNPHLIDEFSLGTTHPELPLDEMYGLVAAGQELLDLARATVN